MIECRFCGKDQSERNIYCTECGESFYRTELPSRIAYETNGKVVIPFALVVDGADLLAIERIVVDGNLVHSYDIDSAANVVAPGDRKEASFEIPIPANLPWSFSPCFYCRLRGEERDFTPHESSIAVYAHPQLSVEDNLSVDPIHGYDISIPIRLVNDSYLTIETLSLFHGTRRIGFVETAGVALDHKGDVYKGLSVAFPSDLGPGPCEFELQVVGADRQVTKTLPVTVTYRRLPSVSYAWWRWTDEGERLIPFSPEVDVLTYYVPKGKNISRRLRVTVEPELDEKTTLSLIRMEPDLGNSKSLRIAEPISNEWRGENDFELVLSDLDSENDQELEFKIADKSQPGGRTQTPIRIRISQLDNTPYPVSVSLDFGTSNSCIALLLPDKKERIDVSRTIRAPVPIELYNREGLVNYDVHVMPTIVRVLAPGQLAFGRRALLTTQGKPVSKVKLGLRENKSERDVSLTPLELSAAFIEEVLRRCTEYLYDKAVHSCLIQRLVVSVPTMFMARWKRRIKEACEIAMQHLGVEDAQVTIVDEALATLRYYIALNQGDISPGLIMVYDFGGGTTDIAIVRAVADGNSFRYETVASGGSSTFGGNTVDHWILGYFVNASPAADESGVTIDLEPDELRVNLGLAEDVKMALNDKNVACDQIRQNFKLDAENSQRAFNDLSEMVKSKMVPLVSNMLDDVIGAMIRRVDSTEPLTIVLAGNASKLNGFPDIVTEALEVVLDRLGDGKIEFSRDSIRTLEEPKYAVSIGAFQSAILPPRDDSFRDIMTYDLLIQVTGELNHERVVRYGNYSYFRLIGRGESIPAQRTFALTELGIGRNTDPFTLFAFRTFGGKTVEPADPEKYDLPGRSAAIRYAVRFSVDETGEVDIELVEEGKE